MFCLVEHKMNQNITHGGLQNKIINCADQNKYTVSQTVTHKLLEISSKVETPYCVSSWDVVRETEREEDVT